MVISIFNWDIFILDLSFYLLRFEEETKNWTGASKNQKACLLASHQNERFPHTR